MLGKGEHHISMNRDANERAKKITRQLSRVAIVVLAVAVLGVGVYFYWAPTHNTPRTPIVQQTPIAGATVTPDATPRGVLQRATPIAQATSTPKVSSVPGGSGPPKVVGGGGPCSAASPYGFTTVNADSSLVARYKDMNVCWLRYQIHQDDIETSPGVYNWKVLDSVVIYMNSVGIHLDVPLQCFDAGCFSSQPAIPTAAEMTDFATKIATRYDGKHGFGYIDAYEIGNEEYVSYDASVYGPILKAGYQAIKAVNPAAIVGMYGPYPSSLTRTNEIFGAIFSGGYGGYMDFLNFHYYNQGEDPTVTVGDRPSFDLKWQTVHNIAAQYGYGSKPIWVTEIGWTVTPLSGRKNVTPEVQSQYMQYVTSKASASGTIRKIFWFTINYGSQGNNIYPPSGPLPAYTALQAFVKQYPIW